VIFSAQIEYPVERVMRRCSVVSIYRIMKLVSKGVPLFMHLA